jgi:hypothetical protein
MNLSRAVSPQELADIALIGGFRPISSSIQGKWFAETPEHAAAWGRRFYQYSGGPFHIVVVEIPSNVSNQMLPLANLDRIGPARYADSSLLLLINRTNQGIHELGSIPLGVP